jgi:hypothetical protein
MTESVEGSWVSAHKLLEHQFMIIVEYDCKDRMYIKRLSRHIDTQTVNTDPQTPFPSIPTSYLSYKQD